MLGICLPGICLPGRTLAWGLENHLGGKHFPGRGLALGAGKLAWLAGICLLGRGLALRTENHLVGLGLALLAIYLPPALASDLLVLPLPWDLELDLIFWAK